MKTNQQMKLCIYTYILTISILINWWRKNCSISLSLRFSIIQFFVIFVNNLAQIHFRQNSVSSLANIFFLKYWKFGDWGPLRSVYKSDRLILYDWFFGFYIVTFKLAVYFAKIKFFKHKSDNLLRWTLTLEGPIFFLLEGPISPKRRKAVSSCY